MSNETLTPDAEVRLVNATTEVFARLVNPTFFLEATRESGYKGTGQAVAELVDNSLQAGATDIHVFLEPQEDYENDVWVYVLDNGVGMDEVTLSLAPQFGGSSRFNDRSGIGRFGMGLPNASVSQCRRFELYSKKADKEILYAYLDLDEVKDGKMPEQGFLTPRPVKAMPIPSELSHLNFESGTLIVWKKCERLDAKNHGELEKRLTGFLGQAFRNFIYVDRDEFGSEHSSRRIFVNGKRVEAFDPLFLDPRAQRLNTSKQPEDKGTYPYDIKLPDGSTGRVTVRFSMLPVEEWQPLPNKEKNALRIVGKTASKGFCIVRAGREVDVTDRFFLIGQTNKDGEETEGRITNNDSWWRCEISFFPELDSVFGITHTKQDIHPNLAALQKVREDISRTVRTLRAEYDERKNKKTPKKVLPAEQIATRSDALLQPMPEIPQDPVVVESKVKEYAEKYTREDETPPQAEVRVRSNLFNIELESAKEGPFYRTEYLGVNTVIYLNTDHPFYTDLYAVLDDNSDAQQSVMLLLFALARGEREIANNHDGRMWYANQRVIWSQILRTYLTK